MRQMLNGIEVDGDMANRRFRQVPDGTVEIVSPVSAVTAQPSFQQYQQRPTPMSARRTSLIWWSLRYNAAAGDRPMRWEHLRTDS